MIYLLIIVLVAGVGITRLWLQQRRRHAHADSVDGFRSSLEKISTADAPAPSRRLIAPPGGPGPSGTKRSGPITPLDPARREAAKQRLAARRAARNV